MKGREGKFYIQKRYDLGWDRWDWYATCWTGDHWYIYQIDAHAPLSAAFDYVLMKAKEHHAEIS